MGATRFSPHPAWDESKPSSTSDTKTGSSKPYVIEQLEAVMDVVHNANNLPAYNTAMAQLIIQFCRSWGGATTAQKKDVAELFQEEILNQAFLVAEQPTIFAISDYTCAVQNMCKTFLAVAGEEYILEKMLGELGRAGKRAGEQAERQDYIPPRNTLFTSATALFAEAVKMKKPSLFIEHSRKETPDMSLSQRFNIAAETVRLQSDPRHYKTAVDALCTKYRLFSDQTEDQKTERDEIRKVMAYEIINQASRIRQCSTPEAVRVMGECVEGMTNTLMKDWQGESLARVLVETFKKEAAVLMTWAESQSPEHSYGRGVITTTASKLATLAEKASKFDEMEFIRREMGKRGGAGTPGFEMEMP